MAEAQKTLLRETKSAGLTDAEAVLEGLAQVFFRPRPFSRELLDERRKPTDVEAPLSNVVARYQTLVEQIPAVVFMAYLDRGIGEAYVSPQIEEMLGFTQEEWLNDPVRWYQSLRSPSLHKGKSGLPGRHGWVASGFGTGNQDRFSISFL